MIQRMIRNSTVPQLYDLDNGETIIISDEDIALELLSRFDPTRVKLLMQGGSAVQLFKGLDARQLKVSNDNTRNAAFDFKSVLSEKSFEKTDANRALTDTKAEQKLNKHEMTSKRTPEVRDAKDDSSAVKQTRNKESESVQEELK
ncbi:hypothetical protein ADUPG1_001517, partial [Aduncisulcus paluster]